MDDGEPSQKEIHERMGEALNRVAEKARQRDLAAGRDPAIPQLDSGGVTLAARAGDVGLGTVSPARAVDQARAEAIRVEHQRTSDALMAHLDAPPDEEATIGDALASTDYPEKLYRDDEVIKIDPTMGQPDIWMQPGARAVWLSKSGKQRLLVQVQELVGSKVLIQTQDGQEFTVAPNTLHEWVEGDLPVASTTAPPRQLRVDPEKDPMRVDPALVRRVVVKVRGKLRYDGPVGKEAGALLTLLAAHGRNMVVTLHMLDGTKQRYRGNGARIA